MFCTVKLERNRLVDGNGDGLGRRVTVVANVNGNCFSLHTSTSLKPTQVRLFRARCYAPNCNRRCFS